MTTHSGECDTYCVVTGTYNSLAEVVRSFLVETFLLGVDDKFSDDESLLDAGIIDSTGVMELVSFLEERFQMTVADEELVADNLDSVNRVAAFVERKLAAGRPGVPTG